MAEEDIDIAKFNFNIDDVLKSASELKTQIDSLKESQKELKRDNKQGTTEFVQQEVAIKALNTEYNRHIKAMTASISVAQKSTIRTQQLDQVLGQNVNTIREAREQNKQLNDLRNDTNLTTAEGAAELELLNAQLDRNNALIAENVDAYTKQKIKQTAIERPG